MNDITATSPAYLFLPHDSDDDLREQCWFAHRVTQVTDKYIFVYSRPCGYGTPKGVDLSLREMSNEKSYRIPRAALQSEGSYAVNGKWYLRFYLEPEFSNQQLEAVQS